MEVGDVEGARVGRFVIVRQLGQGGMGTVYEARDPELERLVALKLLRGKNPQLAMRLLREAQVLAQLQHPNVVGVHALDVHDDQVFIAMELVAGETLDKHIARTEPDWRGIVELFVQAGQGLVAAHGKGIVHRDVKPSNMFVDEDGRVRVGDFGLARQFADGEDPGEPGEVRQPAELQVTTDGDEPSLAVGSRPDRKLAGSTLTHAGALLGTPFFMPPEQYLGKRATPASDQFSFCVALWLALYGEHPFETTALADSIVKGRRHEPGSKRGVPRWLERALDRGLAVDPDERHPSMRALLDVLESHPARRRRLALAGAGVGLVAASVVVWGMTRQGGEQCPVPDAQVAAVWNDARRVQLGERLTAIDKAVGASRFEIAVRRAEQYAASWRTAHVAACKATRVDGEQSDTLLDARMRCLQYRLSELDASLALVENAADSLALDNAVGALAKLTPITTCADPNTLAVEVAAPLAPIARAKSEALLQRIAGLEAKQRATRLDALPAQAAAVVADARALGHSPTLTAALLALARVEIAAYHTPQAEAALRELVQVAARSRDARSEAFAWTSLVAVLGSTRGKPADGLALVVAASAAVIRAGEPFELRVALLHAEAEVLGNAGKPAEALRKLAELRTLLEAEGAKEPRSPHAALLAEVWRQIGTFTAKSGQFAEADTAFEKAIAMMRAVHGPDSLEEARVWNNRTMALIDGGSLNGALETAGEGLRIRQLRTGESVIAAESIIQHGTIYGYQGKWPQAREMYERALRILRAKLPADDMQLYAPLLGYAWVLGGLGLTDEEMRGYDEVIAIFERSGASSANVGHALLNRAETNAARGKCAEALPDYVRAIAVYETHGGKDAMYLVPPLLGHGRCLLLTKQQAAAIPIFERAMKLRPVHAGEAAGLGVRAWLARALIESGQDRARGMQLAREARASLVALAPSNNAAAVELKELDEWFTKLP